MAPFLAGVFALPFDEFFPFDADAGVVLLALTSDASSESDSTRGGTSLTSLSLTFLLFGCEATSFKGEGWAGKEVS